MPGGNCAEDVLADSCSCAQLHGEGDLKVTLGGVSCWVDPAVGAQEQELGKLGQGSKQRNIDSSGAGAGDKMPSEREVSKQNSRVGGHIWEPFVDFIEILVHVACAPTIVPGEGSNAVKVALVGNDLDERVVIDGAAEDAAAGIQDA